MGIPYSVRVRRAAAVLHDGALPALGRWWKLFVLPDDNILIEATSFSFQRLVLLPLAVTAFGVLQSIHWLCHLLDEILFPRYRDVEIRNPVFVVGMPRSGTTLLHRTVTEVSDDFTTTHAWELWLAPSITQRRIAALIAALDQRIGHPVQRLCRFLGRLIFAKFDGVHETAFDVPEEDYFLLTPMMACFLLVVAMPNSRLLWDLSAFHTEVGETERQQILRFYRMCLQKHLFCAQAGRRLLSKNAAFLSWHRDLRTQFPDGRFIVCLRHPRYAAASLLESLKQGVSLFDVEAVRPDFDEAMVDMIARCWGELQSLSGGPQQEFITVLLDRLQSDLDGEIQRVLAACDAKVSPDKFGTLSERAQAAREYRGGERHDTFEDRRAALDSAIRIFDEISRSYA